MGIVSEIKDFIKLVAFNKKIAIVTLIALVIFGVAGYFYYTNKPKPKDECEFCKQELAEEKKEKKELMSFIIEARKGINELAQPTSYIYFQNDSFIFVSDTIPKKKTKQQKSVILLSKFDSVIRADSVKQSKKKSKQ